MNTLDQTLDTIMSLSFEERKTLIEILNKRIIAERREEIVAEVSEAKALYHSGKLKEMNANDSINELHNSLLDVKE
ncbi:MAG: hypothetical protein FJ213_03060 [Ignavibacteria bacterium]|nr:hypothetical protein [Ignavibacteria bacterium]